MSIRDACEQRWHVNGLRQNQAGVCFIAPYIRSSWTTAFCQGEVISQLFKDKGWHVATAPSSWEWSHKPLEVARVLDEAAPNEDVAIIGVFTGDKRLDLVDLALSRAKARSIKTILVLEGGAIPELCQEAPGRVKRLADEADVVVSTSAYITDAVEPLGISTFRIPNTICIEQYPFELRSRARPRLLWMRAFETATYNPELAIRVVRELLPNWPNLTLSMAGMDDGGLDSTCQLAEELGVSGSVTFSDFLEMDEKRRAMRDADIFLNTNRSDNLPVSVIEAAAMGMPVVSTDVGALSEIVAHEESGLLVPSDDPHAMAGAVDRILRDATLAASMSRKARARAETFDASKTYPLWLDALTRAIQS